MTFLKRLEEWNKIVWYNFVFKPLFQNKPMKEPIDIRRVKKILMIRRDMIGDMVITTALLNFIKDLRPDVQLDVLTAPKGYSIVQFDQRLHRVFLFKRGVWEFVKLMRVLREENYDVIFGLSFTGLTLDGIIANIISRRAVKVTNSLEKPLSPYSILFNKEVEVGKHQTPLWRQLITLAEKTFGVEYPDEKVRQSLFIQPEAEQRAEQFLRDAQLNEGAFLMFNISSRLWFRKWGHDRNRQFLQAVSAAHPELRVLLSFIPDDRAEAATLAQSLPDVPLTLLPEGFGLHEVIALTKRAAWLVSPDTANVHIAATFGIPSVILCTPISTSIEWAPIGKNYINIYTEREEPVTAIDPQRVIDAFETLYRASLAKTPTL